MESNNDRYGINIRDYCYKHEDYVRTCIEFGEDPEIIMERHMKKLAFLQHERLVHLIVMVMTAFIVLFLCYMTFCHLELFPYTALFLIAMMILLAFYIRHYFFLENTVQHWYKIEDELNSLIIRYR